MTCIVGLVAENGAVWVGGDSAITSDRWDLRFTRSPKVVRRQVPQVGTLLEAPTRPLLLGTAGAARMRQLLSCALEVPGHPDGMPVETYLATLFVDAVRACFKAGGYARRESDQEQHDGIFLLAYAGHLVTVTSDYLVFESRDTYEAIGSGGELARGALAALESVGRCTLDYLPRRRIEIALLAAARHNASVAGPFHIECLDPEPGMDPETAPTTTTPNETHLAARSAAPS